MRIVKEGMGWSIRLGICDVLKRNTFVAANHEMESMRNMGTSRVPKKNPKIRVHLKRVEQQI